MKTPYFKMLPLLFFLIFVSCDHLDDFIGGDNDDAIETLTFVDEYVLPDGTEFQNTVVGGLSGIDYANGTWYMISDDPVAPIRFYTASLSYGENGFDALQLQSMVELKDPSGASFPESTVDPEAIRYDTERGYIIWTSEGNVNSGTNPSVNIADPDGKYIGEAMADSKFNVSDVAEEGPRHNGAFEGLSLSKDGKGYWVAMELPLVQDGPAPTTTDTESPVRIAYINAATKTFGKEFVYELDAVERPAANGTTFEINGIVELLEYDTGHFLVLERSFATGYDDGGNNVKIYDVDASDATDVSGWISLAGKSYTKADKKLLFDFESIRDQLTDGIVDNVEGIAFGPDFANGNRSLVLIADNNFSAFGPQLNQFLLFEVR